MDRDSVPLGARLFCVCSRCLGDAVKPGSPRHVVLVYNVPTTHPSLKNLYGEDYGHSVCHSTHL